MTTTILIDIDGVETTPAHIHEIAMSVRELLGDRLKRVRVAPVSFYPARKYERRVVTIPIGMDGAVPFTAWVDPNRRWNGWYIPAFEEDAVEELVTALHEDGTYREADFDGHTVYLESIDDIPDGGVFYTPSYFITPAGDVVRVWWIGSGSWTWAPA